MAALAAAELAPRAVVARRLARLARAGKLHAFLEGCVGETTAALRERAARTGRNPKTGKTIEIPASKSPAFKAGKALKDAVN